MSQFNDILDLPEVKKRKEYKTIHLTPLFLLWIGLLSLLLFKPFDQINFFIGLALLIANTVVTLIKREIGIFITGFVILSSVFELLDFFPFEIVFFRLGRIGGFDVLSALFLLSLYVILNEDIFFKYWDKIKPKQTEPKTVDNSKVDHFKEKFKNKGFAELEKIAGNESMVSEARQAAQELLSGKLH
jgi:hypothetical protein